jgi:hypothetical protein
MDLPIRNVDELRAEINRLKIAEQEQMASIKQRVSSPGAILNTLRNLFPRTPQNLKSLSNIRQDFFAMVSKIVLPFTLNKTIFRKSNFIVKGLVTFLSQKASRFVTEEKVTGLVSKITNLFAKKPKRRPMIDVEVTYQGLPKASNDYHAL